MFKNSLELVVAVEAFLLRAHLSQLAPVAYVQRLIWLPLVFLWMGVTEKRKSIFLWALIAFVFLNLKDWAIKSTGNVLTEVGTFVTWISLIVPAFVVLFSLPSLRGQSGVTESSVNFVKQHLFQSGFKNAKEIELLKKSVKLIEDRARNRITALKWIVGLIWAGFGYASSKALEPLQVMPTAILAHFYLSAGLLMAAITAYMLVWGYEASVDKLFRAIEFGCNDFCFEIE